MSDPERLCDCEAKLAFQDNLDALVNRHCHEWTVTSGSLIGPLFMKALSLWHECQHVRCADINREETDDVDLG